MSHSNGNAPVAPPSSNRVANDGIQIDLGDFFQRRKGLLLLGSLVGLILAAMYCLTTPTIYESSTRILVIPRDAKVTTSSNAEFGFDSTVGDELLATHMQIITSPRVIADALGQNELFELPSMQKEVEDETDLDQKQRRTKLVQYVRDNLSVRRGGEGASRDAQVLDVTFRHKSDADCSEILLAIVESYQRYLEDTIQDAGNDAAELISQASSELESRLQTQETEYKKYLTDSPTLLWADLNPQKIIVTQLQTELSNVQIKRAEVESRLDLTQRVVAKAGSGDALPLEKLTVLDKDDIDRVALLVQLEKGYPNSEDFETLKPKLAEAAGVEFQELMALQVESRENELKYGRNHPRAIATREKLTELTKFLAQRSVGTSPQQQVRTTKDKGLDLDRLVAVYEKLLRNDLDDLRSREKELDSLIGGEKQVARSVALAQLEETNLKRGIARTQGLYDAVVARLDQIDLLKGYGGFITDVISPVEVGEPAWPSIPIVGLLGLLLGTAVGGAVAVGAELADKSFRSPNDLEDELGIPILTHVSLFQLNKIKVAEGNPLNQSMVTVHSPRSRYSEAFRSLRTAVFFRTKDIDHPVIQMTSPNAGDGKSTIIANLAASIAQTGKSVLLIDCDMRRPMVNTMFGVESNTGLSDILSGRAGMEEATVDSAVSNLSLIPCGKIPDNPAELLALPDFSDLIAKARQQYDFILLDSPPVTPVADPLTIASISDYVILGMTLRKNSRSVGARTRAELVNNGAEILGLVVNRAADETNRYGYAGGRYGANYGTGYQRYGYGQRYETQTENEAYYSS